MKTLETVNGQKVWTVDSTEGCEGCMFRFDSTGCSEATCSKFCRQDKRNVVFQPYEEVQEKTFTLSQINEVINGMMIGRKSGLKGVKLIYNSVLNELKSKLEQL